MKRLVPEAWRVPVLSLCAVALVALVWTAYGWLHAERVLADLNLSAGQAPDVKIVTAFTPERFHLEKYQALGRYQGWKDGGAVVLSADPDKLRQLARNYWVEAILPMGANP